MKNSKLPFFRLVQPDTEILSALTALYWPSTTKYQPVPPYTDPVPSWINHHRLILIHCHHVPISRAPYWTRTIMYQPVSPSSDPVPPSTDRYHLLLDQYHHISTSTTKYQSIPTYTDPVPSYINQYRLLLTQYHQVPTSTTPYWPGTTKYQAVPTYTVVAWGLQTPAQFTRVLFTVQDFDQLLKAFNLQSKERMKKSFCT